MCIRDRGPSETSRLPNAGASPCPVFAVGGAREGGHWPRQRRRRGHPRSQDPNPSRLLHLRRAQCHPASGQGRGIGSARGE
eukprot:1657415-Alexandrium_andersonii.AAC.1